MYFTWDQYYNTSKWWAQIPLKHSFQDPKRNLINSNPALNLKVHKCPNSICVKCLQLYWASKVFFLKNVLYTFCNFFYLGSPRMFHYTCDMLTKCSFYWFSRSNYFIFSLCLLIYGASLQASGFSSQTKLYPRGEYVKNVMSRFILFANPLSLFAFLYYFILSWIKIFSQ